MRNRHCYSWIVPLLLVLSGSMQAAEKEAGKRWDLMWAVKNSDAGWGEVERNRVPSA